MYVICDLSLLQQPYYCCLFPQYALFISLSCCSVVFSALVCVPMFRFYSCYALLQVSISLGRSFFSPFGVSVCVITLAKHIQITTTQHIMLPCCPSLLTHSFL